MCGWRSDEVISASCWKRDERVAVLREAAVEQLHREAPRQARVRREIDLAAAAFGEGANDPVRPLQHDPDRQAAGGGPDQVPGKLCFRFDVHFARLRNAATVPG